MADRTKLKELVEKEKELLIRKEKELAEKVKHGIESGKAFVGHENEEFKKQVRGHPLEYVAGAFILGLVIGKLLK